MVIVRLTRIALALSILGIAVYSGLAHGQGTPAPVSKDLAAAAQEVEQQEAALAKAGHDRNQAAQDAFYADNMLDMHTSGWLYDKQGGIDVIRNGNLIQGGQRPFKSDISKRQVVAYSRDLVAVVWVSTMYYPVPDPEDLADAQGIKTLDPAAVAKARVNLPPGPLPGERYAPNPYRARYIRMWMRDPKTSRWQVIISAAAKITARTLPGRYPEVGLGNDSEIDR
jgi:hypothetical protein